MMEKTILVTGGAGFIGSNFVRHIFQKYPNYKIIVLDALTYAGSVDNFLSGYKDDPRFTFWYGNVRNGELVNTLVAQADIVFHFAAESHVARSIFDNMVFYETDVLGTQVVVNAVLKHRKSVEKFVHISSSEVYGTAIQDPMTEEHPLNPLTPYASAKTGADRLVYSYWKTYKIPVVIVRPFNNYGPYQHLEKAIPRFITSALLDEPLTIHGNGECERDWVFVEDCCLGLEKILNTDPLEIAGEVINLGTGSSRAIISVARLILSKMGKPDSLIKHITDRPGQVDRHISSTEKSAALLSWKTETCFEAGLEKTIQWYKENRFWWEKRLWMRSIQVVLENGQRAYY
ncbi:MAG: dTDP-glucose 4,6-dehydratase [Nitrospinota bacterium]